MKVLYFHQHFSTPKGSTGIRSYAMAQKLLAKGHSVTIVCGSYAGGATGLENKFTNGKREGQVNGIQVIEFDLVYSNNDGFFKRAYSFFIFALRSVGIALTEQYDLVFATSTPLTAGIPGIIARWLRGKTFVFEVRDLWPELPKEMGVITNPIALKLLKFLELTSYRSAHRLIGLSPGIVDGIKKLGVKQRNVTMIPNGCYLDIFSRKNQAWKPNGVNDSDLIAIFTGTHGIANGLDELLNVAKELKDRGRTNIKIVLVGQGKLKQNLQLRAQEENLSNVIFHDAIDKARLAGLMNAADIGLQVLANVPAFYYGTSPNKFFDYISAGLPVINNYPGWLSEMIKENDCGLVVAPEDFNDFADALEFAADNREKIEIMGQNSRRLAETLFDRERLSAQFVTWLEDTKK